ncbi:MAG: HipA domain-containing protein [bacterium]
MRYYEGCVGGVEPVDDEEIRDILNKLEYIPLGVEQDRPVRFSLAGQQAKTAFLRWEDQWLRPLGSTPTSHIFKPQIKDPYIDHTVENEWISLKFARQLGLPVADVSLETFGEQTVLVIERFDRRINRENKSIHRIHQEDYCQILGRPHTQKYERTEEGERLVEQCLEKLRVSAWIREDQALFIRGQIVHWKHRLFYSLMK